MQVTLTKHATNVSVTTLGVEKKQIPFSTTYIYLEMVRIY